MLSTSLPISPCNESSLCHSDWGIPFSKQRRPTEDASCPFQALSESFCRCLLSQTECNEEPWTSPKKFRNPEKRHALGCEGSFSIFTISRKWDFFENLGTSCFENGIVCHPSFKFDVWLADRFVLQSTKYDYVILDTLQLHPCRVWSTQSLSLAQRPQC